MLPLRRPLHSWLFRFAGALLVLMASIPVGGCKSSLDPKALPFNKDGPRLVVLVVFDQMRADYLTRWESLFDPEGIGRLQKEGAWFQNCHLPYAASSTAPGHASLATGAAPSVHGIIENDWWDRTAGEVVNSANTDRYRRVPSLASELGPGTKEDRGDGSPERLLAPTFADSLKEASGGRARVVSLSLKDRGAVFTGGRKADACYWFDLRTGTFVTSTFYRDQPHPWVAELNRERVADRWFEQLWDRLRPELDYVRYSGPDDVSEEEHGIGQGRIFPHPMNGGGLQPGKLYYKALYNSPFGNELLLELAKRAIDVEGLGSRDAPDLLCVSFSSSDPVGHCWGPDSQEMLDTTLRSDRLVKELLAHLDAKVGPGRYFLVLASDHGVCPLTQVSRQQGREAGRVSAGDLGKALAARFGGDERPAAWVEAAKDYNYYLNRKAIHQRGLNSDLVEESLAAWFRRQPGFLKAYSRGQIKYDIPADDAIGQKVRGSFHADRSGDVVVVLKPYHLEAYSLTGTNHGTPHPYDTHVPLLVFGPGVRPGVRPEPVALTAATAILAKALGVPSPAQAEAGVPDGLFTAP